MSESNEHPAAWPPERLHAACAVRFVRRSGPGGQHRNKVSTGVVLVHTPTGVQAEASERRSQAENLTAARFRLRLALALQVRIVRCATDVPSALWRSRCGGTRICVSATHTDFPGLLAEALDVLAAQEYDVAAAAGALQCSSSQLVRLLQKTPAAFTLVNTNRQQRGLHPLR